MKPLIWKCFGLALVFALSAKGVTPTAIDYVGNALQKYWNAAELATWVTDYGRRCASVAKVSSIGTSTLGLPLHLVTVGTGGVATPRFAWIGNIHGDEPLGRQLLPALAEYLCSEYAKGPSGNKRAQQLVNSVTLQLLPCMNPDGFQGKGSGPIRYNANGVDLNRDFPDPLYNFDYTKVFGRTLQKETVAVMTWAQTARLTASAVLHEGALVAVYPWDGHRTMRPIKNATEDDATFLYLSRRFAALHADMRDKSEFPNGIINGADWYSINGSVMNWMYPVQANYDLTIELDVLKMPDAATLPKQWDRVRKAFIQYPLFATLGGVRGTVVDAGNHGLQATITIDTITARVVSNPAAGGVFFRPVKPGTYTLHVSCQGYVSQTRSVTVPTNGSGIKVAIVLQRLSKVVKVAAAPAANGTQLSGDMDTKRAMEANTTSHLVQLPSNSSALPAWDPPALADDDAGVGQQQRSQAELPPRPDVDY